MKRIVPNMAVFAVLTIAFCVTSQASAQLVHAPRDHCGHGHGSRWFGLYESPYATGRIPTPPYFAIHPPVYYSYAVPRSYGYSPFAYPGSVATPEVKAAPKSAEIINPHIKRPVKEASDNKFAKQLPKSQLIINPYYDDPELQPGVELAKARQ